MKIASRLTHEFTNKIRRINGNLLNNYFTFSYQTVI